MKSGRRIIKIKVWGISNFKSSMRISEFGIRRS